MKKERILILCATLILLAPSALAQDASHDLTGFWEMEMDMQAQSAAHQGGSAGNPVHRVQATYEKETLQLAVMSGGDVVLRMRDVSHENGKLQFMLPTGHADITCALYRQEESETFSGLCGGPAGEVATTLKKVQENTDH